MSRYCTCEKCGKKAIVDDSIVLISYPEKFNYSCPHCGNTGYVLCDDTIDEKLDDCLKAFDKAFHKAMDKIWNETRERHEKLIAEAKKSIKHPLWQYASICFEQGTFEIRKKSFKLFWKTFGRRIVAVKIVPLKVHPLMGFLANEKSKEKNK